MNANRRQWSVSPQWLDHIEKLLLSILYGCLVLRILGHIDHKQVVLNFFGNLPLLISEGLVLVLALIRRPTLELSPRVADWLLAFCATGMPLLVAPVASGQAFLAPQLFVMWMLFALAFQIYAKLELGRSFGLVAAHRGLRLQGPYRLVRHPIYLGYLLMHVCFALRNPSWRNLLLYAGFYALQLPRIVAEERILMNDPQYRDYAGRVKWRLIPWVY